MDHRRCRRSTNSFVRYFLFSFRFASIELVDHTHTIHMNMTTTYCMVHLYGELHIESTSHRYCLSINYV